jgi:hypothetical protein
MPSLISYLSALLGLFFSLTSATSLTYKLWPTEHECFYAHVSQQNAKVAFYFAVQSGGDFDSTCRVRAIRIASPSLICLASHLCGLGSRQATW